MRISINGLRVSSWRCLFLKVSPLEELSLGQGQDQFSIHRSVEILERIGEVSYVLALLRNLADKHCVRTRQYLSMGDFGNGYPRKGQKSKPK
ncbi:hypothetical protein Tco_0648219 [Tanacetum coccineum]